ncbi:methionyl-tRNA formyltransferase [Niabella terrae]
MTTEDYRDLRIVFMGTPEFAVASLSALLDAGCRVVAVITAPDKPAGRGMKLSQSAVKQFALEQQFPVLQPIKLKDPEFLEALQAFQADLQICVAFRMLPETVWNMPRLGTINLHGSLLPQYRGAAPINWAIINGEQQTGVTTFKLKHEIDTGDLLLQQTIPIAENDTAGTLHDTMKDIGATLLVETVQGLAKGTIQEKAQILPEAVPVKTAPKIFTETCQIDFNQSLEKVYNLIRGLSPYPAAFTFLDGRKLKIFIAEKHNGHPAIAAGAYQTDGKTFLRFACNDGWLDLKELQLEGKKRMPVTEFLKGYRFNQDRKV